MASAYPRQRRNVVFAFWGTILLGFPLWYITTQVSRAPLPLIPVFEDIRPRIPVVLKGLSDESTHKLVSGLNLLQNELDFVDAEHQIFERQSTYEITWSEGDPFTSSILPGTRQWSIQTTKDQAVNIEESIMAYMLDALEDERSRLKSIVEPSVVKPDLRVVKYNPSYDLVFSLLNGGGVDSIQSWPIQESLESVLDPLLAQISPLAKFTVESQIQYYADLTFQPTFDEDVKAYVLTKADLNNFINSAEWNLASAQSQSKPLNFILYIPRPEHRPLVIRHDGQSPPTNSFLIPQFGSITIHNPPATHPYTSLPQGTLSELIRVQVGHFLTLLGLPEIARTRISGDTSLWRLDGLFRQRIVETIHSAQLTLHSIPKIVDQIPNMHVPAHVSDLIFASLQALTRARERLAQADLEGSIDASRRAVEYAEQAFFDDQMVSLLYFPDEHKYGVYMPLFGPLFLPLGMALIKELKVFLDARKRKRRRKQKKEQSERRQLDKHIESSGRDGSEEAVKEVLGHRVHAAGQRLDEKKEQ